MKQKIGISLIAAWYAISGVLILLIAAGFGFGAAPHGLPPEIAAMGAVFLSALALVPFAIAYGIYNCEAWGWYVVMILSVINVASALVNMNARFLVVPALIIWYLWGNQRDFGVRIKI